MKLEVVVIPVADVDRAKDFYASLGWRLDADFATGDGLPRRAAHAAGLAGSVIFGTDITTAAPGLGRRTCTSSSPTSRRPATSSSARGVDVSEVFHDAGGVFHPPGPRRA